MAQITIGEMVQVSLKTTDVGLARSRHAIADAALRRFWDAERAGPIPLTHMQIVGLSGELYRAFATSLEANPGSPERWQKVRQTNAAAQRGELGTLAVFGIGLGAAERRKASLEGRFGAMADNLLGQRGLVTDLESRQRLIEESARALDEAAAKLELNAAGDYRPDPTASRFPAWQEAAKPSGPTLLQLYKLWAQHPENSGLAPRTKAAYLSAVSAAARHLGNPPVSSITRSDLRTYFDVRMNASGPTRLQPRVARDVHKAALSSVLGWAVDREFAVQNVALEVPIKVPSKTLLRHKGASDQEALALSEAALAIPSSSAPRTRSAARRWCALLIMYSGCRIGEIAQLRVQDIVERQGYPMLEITPDAGHVKNKQFRLVPIHPRLVELGFLDYVASAGSGPLFFDPSSRRKASARAPLANTVSADLAEWVRANGLGDPRLSRPLHSLRHRFMTIARWSKVEQQYVSAIVGHAPGDQNQEYGHFPPEVLRREMLRLDADKIEGRASGSPASAVA